MSLGELAAIAISVLALVLSWVSYSRSRHKEQAEFFSNLYERFFFSSQFSDIKHALDWKTSSRDLLLRYVSGEAPNLKSYSVFEDFTRDTLLISSFTDYLNFFVLLSYLIKKKQLSREDVVNGFGYYLQQLNSLLDESPHFRRYLENGDDGFKLVLELLERTRTSVAKRYSTKQ
ncbi:MAG: hypothetical protein SFY70_11670 [Bacteroidia bacterium]|nr:hypothetical protein [Bacteroidia bacterium]